MEKKLLSYLGFARKSRNLTAGSEGTLSLMKRGKVKAIILCEDISSNTKKRIIEKAERFSIEYRVYGDSLVLSNATGTGGTKRVFAITDEHFARIICEEIDRIQSEREEF